MRALVLYPPLILSCFAFGVEGLSQAAGKLRLEVFSFSAQTRMRRPSLTMMEKLSASERAPLSQETALLRICEYCRKKLRRRGRLSQRMLSGTSRETHSFALAAVSRR